MLHTNARKYTMNELFMLILIGLSAGILSGLVGIGGGIILVPALVMLLKMNQHQAQGTVLALLMMPVVALGVLNYYKQGHVDFKVAFMLAIGFTIGAFFGSKLAIMIPEYALKKVFGVLMLVIAIKLIFWK
jgi:uncharacterized protein